jgi:hypothetical protein
MQKSLRNNCEKKVTPEVEAKVRAAEDTPITFGDFEAALKDIVVGGASGPSMATASMVKGWSTEIRQCTYTHMSALWQMRETPQWMKHVRLKLAPKVSGNSQMKNMRPISIYKVIRKVCTTTIAKRIHRVLHEADVLHGEQSGYRLDQGIMMSLLQVINQIEGAIYSDKYDTSKHITFWDIRRAFDSIPRNL